MWEVCDGQVGWAAVFRLPEHFSVCVIQRKLKSIILTVTLSGQAARAGPAMPTVTQRIEIIRGKNSSSDHSANSAKNQNLKTILTKYEMT